MAIVLLSVLVVALAMFVMAVGVLLSGRCLRGSCGGPEALGPDGESLLCDDCPRRDELAARREADLVALDSGLGGSRVDRLQGAIGCRPVHTTSRREMRSSRMRQNPACSTTCQPGDEVERSWRR